MSFFDKPQILTRNNSYFAAINSKGGFVSYFDEIFGNYKQHIIKGGPGSGKSTFLRRVADRAEKEGYSVTRFYCSSDTDSLDGITIDEKGVAILDGTAPHTTEPRYIGASDRILDFSSFWSLEKLENASDEIISLDNRIAQKYKRVYRLMNSASELERAAEEVSAPLFNKIKAEKIINRLLSRIRGIKYGGKRIRPTAAFGTSGFVTLDTDERASSEIYRVKDRYNISERFFSVLEGCLARQGVAYYVSYLPASLKVYSIYLPRETGGVLFTLENKGKQTGKTINLERLISVLGREERREIKELSSVSDGILLKASRLLSEIGTLHDRLEEFYIAATDYKRLDLFTEKYINELLS